ncbi:hypothetical protein [Natrialba sp. SSL1]|uniref:hypothetical protein n=1 Tax=Natrialba sp. SSL1 TaxID=1869245 RepID=UPI0008F8CE5B|nr:hypothetical protein [Natrialba sp. SSL1]OIB55773.1 hypothetical protein BBD46_02890 [Natrialba sp. SSL1]
MRRNFGLIALLIAGVFAAAIIGVTAVAATADAEMTADPAIDTPTETVDIRGDDYEVDQIAVVEQGETLEVDVSDTTEYDLLLYNTDAKIEAQKDEDSTLEFEIDESIEPGGYMLTLETDEDREAVIPVVVQGYDISLEYPATVDDTEDVTFDATVESAGIDGHPDEFELVIWSGDTATELTLEHTDGTSYSATKSMSALGTDTYEVYGAVIGDDTVEGYEVPNAVVEGSVLTVTDSAEDEDDDTGDDDSNGDSETDDNDKDETDDNEGTDDDDTEVNDEESDKGDDEADTDENGDTDGNGDDVGTDENGDEETNNESETDGSDDDGDSNVIDPNEAQETDDTAGSTDGSDDGLGISTAVLTLLAVAAVLVAVTARDH